MHFFFDEQYLHLQRLCCTGMSGMMRKVDCTGAKGSLGPEYTAVTHTGPTLKSILNVIWTKVHLAYKETLFSLLSIFFCNLT